MTTEEARALRFPEPAVFLEYVRALRVAAVPRVRAMSEAYLAEAVLLKPWGELPRIDHIGQVLIAHGNSHLGKASLARTLLGIVPPTSGTAMLAGTPLPPRYQARSREQLRSLQIVFQNQRDRLWAERLGQRAVVDPDLLHRAGLAAGQREDLLADAIEAKMADIGF